MKERDEGYREGEGEGVEKGGKISNRGCTTNRERGEIQSNTKSRRERGVMVPAR